MSRRRQRISPRAPPRWRRQKRRREDPTRARLYRRARALCTPITTRSTTARACRPMPRPWKQLAQRYPNDDEAQIYYALALNTSASPADKTYANQLKGAAILEPIAKRQPQHPGVAHYLIHLYDYPPIAEKGLDAARRYAKIAPAQRMPSICPRTSSRASAIGRTRSLPMPNRRGSRRRTRRATTSCTPWTISSTPICSSARTRRRKAVIDEMNAVTGFTETFIRRAIRAGRLAGALCGRARRLEGRGGASGPPEPAGTRAGDHAFRTRAGAARSGNPDAAKADIAKLAELRDKLREAKDAYWSEQVDIQRQVATAWVLYAEGKHDDALKAMSAAADAEDKTEKHPVTPGVPKPARELYGVMLLESGMAKEALAAFEATLKKEPNRLGAYVGRGDGRRKVRRQGQSAGILREGRCDRWRRGRRPEPKLPTRARFCRSPDPRGAMHGRPHRETPYSADRAGSALATPAGAHSLRGHRILRSPRRMGTQRHVDTDRAR